MSARQIAVAGWALLTERMEPEQVAELQDALDAPPASSEEARRERAALVASLKKGR